MKWPDHADINAPISGTRGELVMTEAYWLYGILKISLIFIPVGFYWTTRDIAGGISALLLFGLPIYVMAAFGIGDLFRRRRYSFFPNEQRVEIEGFSLFGGRVAATFSYSQFGTEVMSRWVLARPIHKRYFAMFRFPGIQVAFFSSPKEKEVMAAMPRLLAQLGLTKELNRPAEPMRFARGSS